MRYQSQRWQRVLWPLTIMMKPTLSRVMTIMRTVITGMLITGHMATATTGTTQAMAMAMTTLHMEITGMIPATVITGMVLHTVMVNPTMDMMITATAIMAMMTMDMMRTRNRLTPTR